MIPARTCRTGTPMPTGSEETGSDTEWARPGPRAKPGRRSARRHCPAGRDSPAGNAVTAGPWAESSTSATGFGYLAGVPAAVSRSAVETGL